MLLLTLQLCRSSARRSSARHSSARCRNISSVVVPSRVREVHVISEVVNFAACGGMVLLSHRLSSHLR